MMGISTPGQPVPQAAPQFDGTTFTMFDDFLYTPGTPGNEFTISAPQTGLGNPLGADPAHPGVVFADLSSFTTGQMVYQISSGGGQFWNMTVFSKFTLEWVWRIQATGGFGANGLGLMMGNGGGGPCSPQVDIIGIGVKTTVDAGCFLVPTVDDFYLISTDDANNHNWQLLSAKLSNNLNAWHKFLLSWDAGTGFCTAFLDGVNIGQSNTRMPLTGPGSIPGIFGFGVANVGGSRAPAGTYMMIDYFKFTATLAR